MSAIGAAASAPARTAAREAQRSLWGDAYARLRRNRGAMFGLVLVGLAVVLAIFAPFVAPHDPLQQDTVNNLREPFWGNPRYRHGAFPLGTDQLGRDILSRLIWSSRVALAVGLVPVAITFVIGGVVGMLSGYFGGWVDAALMRLVDVTYAFPELLLIIIVMTAARGSAIGEPAGGVLIIFLSLAVVGWVGVARLTRGQALTLKERDFVEAARSIGATDGRIMTRHVLPNALGPIIVAAAFGVPRAILAETSLSFLGIGVRPPTVSWGVMINEGFAVISTSPWPVVLPAVCISIVMLSFAFIGDGLRDALDPRQRI